MKTRATVRRGPAASGVTSATASSSVPSAAHYRGRQWLDTESARKVAQARLARAEQRLKDVRSDLHVAQVEYRQAQEELGELEGAAGDLPVRRTSRAVSRGSGIRRDIILALLIGLGISAVLLPALYFLVPGVRQQFQSQGGAP